MDKLKRGETAQFFALLRQHIGAEKPDFGNGDSPLSLLYEVYNELNSMDTDQIRADFEALYPYDYDAIETVLKRGTEKARQAIYAEYSLRRDWYEVDIEISEDQEELFTNEVIKDYFKHLLTDAIQKKEVMFFNQPAVFDGGWTVHNEPTLTALYEDSIDFFQKYYDGDLTYDAMTIQRRVIRQYEKGLI